MKNKNDPLTNSRTPELIATYEELYRIPESERVTCYIGDYGGHFFRHGAAEDTILMAKPLPLSEWIAMRFSRRRNSPAGAA